MPNIKNTNQVIVNNNIKAQDELKILSKLSKMGLLKSQAKQRKRAPSQARMSPQMIPQAPEVGRIAPVSFDRSAVDSQIRAATEEAIRRTAMPSRTNDLENDTRMTNQGSQDIQRDGGIAGTIDVAPEAETTFASGAQEDEGINTELVREQEQEVPEQRQEEEQTFKDVATSGYETAAAKKRLDDIKTDLENKRQQFLNLTGITMKEALRKQILIPMAEFVPEGEPLTPDVVGQYIYRGNDKNVSSLINKYNKRIKNQDEATNLYIIKKNEQRRQEQPSAQAYQSEPETPTWGARTKSFSELSSLSAFAQTQPEVKGFI